MIANGDCIELPPESKQVEHEGELGVVMGRRARNIPSDEDPLDYVLGYTCVNDVTARDLQRKDVQFTRAKSFDTFCPVGPFIVSGLDPLTLVVTTRVNGNPKTERPHFGYGVFSSLLNSVYRRHHDSSSWGPDCDRHACGSLADEGRRYR